MAAAPLAAIVGPTASGKSELAMALAPMLDAEILVADSRQVYRGMDLGTAKPSAADRARIPHHLLDLVDPDEQFSVADWTREAHDALDRVTAQGHLPLVVGGTGLYVSSLIDGYDYESQPHSPEKRAALALELEGSGLEPLADRLRRLAPDLASVTDLRNPRRVLRALERVELAPGPVGTGSGTPHLGPLALIGLARPRAVLYRRIDLRARALFAGGLLDEVRTLLARGLDAQLSPMTSHGYGEAARHLAGEWSLEQAIDVTARRTRQYAKRQLTWFRRDARIAWLDAAERPGGDPELVDAAHRAVRRLLARPAPTD